MGKKENTTDEALLAGEKQKKKKLMKCFNCNKCRHKKANCWAKGGRKEGQGLKGKGGKRTDSGNAAQDDSNDLEAFSAQLVSDNEEHSRDREPQAALAEGEESGMTMYMDDTDLYDSRAS